MSVKEVLSALGSWNVELTPALPEDVRTKIGFFGHVAVIRGRVDVDLHSDADLLRAARYVGVIRDIDLEEARSIGGAGMVFWLGDEDGKGQVLEAKVTLTNATLSAALTAVLPAAVTLGTVYALTNPAARITRTFQYVTPREAVQAICDHFDVEFRVNGNGTIDVGRQDQLYSATPDSIVVRKGAGIDMDTVALGGRFGVQKSAVDYSDRILLVGKTQEDATFVNGAIDAPVKPYRDLFGNTTRRTRMISESGTTTGTLAQRLQLQLNRYNRTATSLKVSAEDYEIEGNFVVGDMTDVYDPETGIVNAARERYFRADVIHPDIVRISELSWSITRGHTVALRTQAGEWIDLTPWTAFESGGTNEIVVGDLPKSLTNPSGNPVLDRADSLPDSSIPSAPTGLALSTQSYLSGIGGNAATVFASWTPPTTNVDGTSLLDLSHYIVRHRPTFRAPLWDVSYTNTAALDFPATVGLGYDVQVAAVDKAGNVSAFTPVLSITAAQDATAPGTPSDPSISSYYGQLRIEWDGLTATGSAMPPDFNRVDVHVGTTNGFTPTAATLIDSLSTKGVSYATAPYGSPRYVRFIAYDHAGNASGASGSVLGTTVQVGPNDISSLSVGKLTAGIMSADVTISGRFATALTGARTEMNALGLQKFDSSNNLLVSITGTDALLTGRYRSAISGRRIEMGSAGLLGEINFFAPDGKVSYVRAFTEGTGVEAIQLGLTVTGDPSLWNRININSDQWMSIRSRIVDLSYLGTEGGFFTVRERSARTGGTVVNRLYLEDSYSAYRNPDATTEMVQWADGHVSFTSNGDVTFTHPQNNSRVVLQHLDGRADVSLYLQLANDYNYAANFRFLSTNTGASSRLELRDAGTGYQDLHCGPVTEFSSEAGKTAIRAFDGDALAKIRALKVKRYRRKGPKGEKVNRDEKTGAIVSREEITGVDGPETIGLVAEEAFEVAPEIVTLDETGTIVGLQTGARVTLLERAIQQIADELDKLKGKKP
jgi:hypothetical protein